MRSRPWQLVGIAALVVVALLAALLLKDRDTASPADRLAAAADAIDDERTAHLSLVVSVEASGTTTSVTGEGAVDVVSGHGWFTSVTGGREVELRTNGATVYVRPGGATTWLAAKADEADALGPLAVGSDVVIALIDVLRGDAEVDDAGRDERGRHLRAVVDVESAAGAVDGRRAEGVDALGGIAKKPGSLPVDVWLDDDDRPVRARIRGVIGNGIPVVLTVELSGFGDPLGSAIPPEGATRDVEGDELGPLLAPAPGSG